MSEQIPSSANIGPAELLEHFATAPPPDPEIERRLRRSLRWKIAAGVLVGMISAGASALSCAGQSFSLRQARALERIEQHLNAIERQRCAPSP